MKVVTKYKNYIKHFIVYLLSFCLNYLIFILFMLLISNNNILGIFLFDVLAWIISMLFIFFVDKKFVPDLLDENNSKEIFKFILIRLLSLIVEFVILYIFVCILKNDYYIIKLISLGLLFILNDFYVRHIRFE